MVEYNRNLFPFTTLTFRTATKAAAAGGVTTLVDMPLNSLPPTTTTENLRVKAEAAIGQCWVNVKFWGGVIPGNTPHLKEMVDMGLPGELCSESVSQ